MKVCKACFAHVRDLKRLRGHLAHEAALMAANALVGSRLDYCNSPFRGLSALDLRKLQCVQNNLARIVANTTKYSHITPVRKALNWLPIKYRSIFKTAVLVYKFLHSGNPKYFEPFLIPRHSARQSQFDGMFLEVPHFASVFKSQKHFGLSFAYDLEWPSRQGALCKLTCLLQVKAEVIPLWKSISTLNFQSPPAFSVVLTPAMSLVYEY